MKARCQACDSVFDTFDQFSEHIEVCPERFVEIKRKDFAALTRDAEALKAVAWSEQELKDIIRALDIDIAMLVFVGVEHNMVIARRQKAIRVKLALALASKVQP